MAAVNLNHVGWVVHSIADAQSDFFLIGYEPCSEVVFDAIRNIKILFLKNTHGQCIELIEPVSDTAYGKNILKKFGPTPYHLCVAAENPLQLVDDLKKQGFIVIDDYKVAPALSGHKVIFLFSKHIGIIEIVG